MAAKIIGVMFFGAMGCGLRWLSLEIASRLGAGTPERIFWATMAVNILGCYFIGVLYALLPVYDLDETELWWRECLSVGLLGGYTTFSAFSAQTVDLLTRGHFVLAALNVLLSVSVCLVATWAGLVSGRSWAA